MDTEKSRMNRISYIILLIGLILFLVSMISASSYVAILGTAAVFWGIILFYIKPSRHLPLDFFDILTQSQFSNTERILNTFDSNEKGIYLPPKNLRNIESSMIFIPKFSETVLPIAETDNEELLYSKQTNCLFLTPPGIGLSKLLEREGSITFTRVDFKTFKETLPKILIDRLELAEELEINTEDGHIAISITGSVFDDNCNQAKDYPRTHTQVGCVLSSALACILAKVLNQPILIQDDIIIDRSNVHKLHFQAVVDQKS
jgi:hypothetical protein